MRTFLRMSTEAREKLKMLVCRHPHRKKPKRQGGCCPLLRARLKPPREWQSVLGFIFKSMDTKCVQNGLWVVAVSQGQFWRTWGLLTCHHLQCISIPVQLFIDPRTEPGPLPIKGEFSTPGEFPQWGLGLLGQPH